jgi:hypothetical protein
VLIQLIYILVSSMVVKCFLSLLHVVVVIAYMLQSDDACCNSCEEVREAYRKKGWALSDPESIDQVY